MANLVVRLLGGFRVELDGETVYDFKTDKARALLAYLVVEADRPHRRETLAALLWPDRPDDVARTNLRLALSRVRRALAGAGPSAGPPFLFVTSSDVQFNTASDYSLDVAELEVFARHDVARSPAGLAQLLPEALCGDFLAGFAVPDSEGFQAWVLNKQEHYHQLALEILDAQGAHFEGAGEYGKAAAAARLQLQLEPWLEEAHQRCMRALALAGRREEALHQYDACRRILQSELALEPTALTQALYVDIRAQKLAPVAPRPDSFSKPVPSGAHPPELPTRLVARGDELGQLGRYLDAALAGETGLAFVCGDAGSGKTALLEVFAASAMADHPDLLVAGARCSPGGGLDACAPLRRLAEMLFGDFESEVGWRLPAWDQVDRLRRATDVTLASLAEHGPDLAGALVPAASVARRAGLLEEAQICSSIAAAGARLSQAPLPQGALFDLFTGTLAAIAQQLPLLLVIDDLHWVDDGTAAFLLHLGLELRRSRLLVVGAYRTATVALGRRDPRSGEMVRHPLAPVINELRRARGEILVNLDRADGRAFVEAYLDTEPNRLSAQFRDALYGQTGGHALFTVETLRNLQQRGELFKDEAGRWVVRESLHWGDIPARVEAAIAERIDRLPEDNRQLLSAACVQGDSFSAEAVAELTGATLQAVMGCFSGSIARQHHLVRPDGLHRLGSSQQSFYRFTHHLFQKYLYDQLDSLERGRLHRGVAASLDRQMGSDPDERERLAERLAWHCEEGGLPLQAARALLDAGNQAMRLSAFREAINRYDRGLALLAAAPPSAEQRQMQRLLEVAWLAPARHLEGLASAAMQGALARAAEAWAAGGSGSLEGEAQERPKLMLLLSGLEDLTVTADFESALAAAEELEEQATRSGEEGLAGVALLYRAMVNQALGDLQESEEHIARLIGRLTPEQRAGLRTATGIDLLANALGFSALNAWFLGRPEVALARSRQAIAAARADGATVGEAAACALGASLLFLLGGHDGSLSGELAEVSERCHELCVQQGLSMWRVVAEVMLGRVMVMAGDDLAGIERIRGAGWQAGRLMLLTDLFAAILADSCLVAAERGAAERGKALVTGLAAIDSKLGVARKSGMQAYEAELHRLRGELLLARDGLSATEEALDCFQHALELGRKKGAVAWELRAALSLVRLRERQGQAYAAELAQARRCLGEVYIRFTEGFSFPDLREGAQLFQHECAAGQSAPFARAAAS